MSDELTALFEPRHARRYSGISFEIRRSIGVSVATSLKKRAVDLPYTPVVSLATGKSYNTNCVYLKNDRMFSIVLIIVLGFIRC